MKVRLKNDVDNYKECKIGFSWTTFFFGFFVPFIRGDFKWGAIILVIQFILAFLTMGIGSFVVSMCFSFFYNKLYINDLLQKGYAPASDADATILGQRM